LKNVEYTIIKRWYIMLAFLKGIGGYIGGTIAGKVIVVAVAAATVATGGAVVVHSQATQTQSKPIMTAVMESESMSSSDVNSVIDSTVATDPSSAVSEINQAASEGVSQVQQAASKAVSQVQSTQPVISATEMLFAVINPDTGEMVWPDMTNYTAYKAALGGDAGTVDPAKSTAIAAARVKIAAAKAAVKAAAQSAAQAALSSSTAS